MNKETIETIAGQDADELPPLPQKIEFMFKCHGRDCEGNETLDNPSPVILTVYQNPMRSVISTDVTCKWCTGGHHQRCMASHQDVEDHDKHEHKVYCPYATSIGHLEGSWKSPAPIHRNY